VRAKKEDLVNRELKSKRCVRSNAMAWKGEDVEGGWKRVNLAA